MNGISLTDATVEHFQSYVGEKFLVFRLESKEALTELELVEAVATSSKPFVPGGKLPFSLIFEGPVSVPLAQDLWGLSVSEGETLTLFLVPIGRKDDRMQYQAVFS